MGSSKDKVEFLQLKEAINFVKNSTVSQAKNLSTDF